MRRVAISTELIRLGQLLKLADAVASGADVKPLLRSGSVQVNGMAETRRGRQIAHGDVVTIDGDSFVVAGAALEQTDSDSGPAS